MRAVVGLRNPGPEYQGTRHNVGFEVLESLAGSLGERLGKGPPRTRCETATVMVGGVRGVLAAPQTYMNESGRSVRSIADYFSVEPAEMLVIHDDIDLPFGRLRVRAGGGTGGHNGLRSIESALGTRDFARLKVGVGRPPGSMDPADFVLRRFTKAERAEVDLVVADAVDVVTEWFGDEDAAIRRAATRSV